MWSSCDICATLWLTKRSDAILHARLVTSPLLSHMDVQMRTRLTSRAHILSHHTLVKVLKSKFNLQCLKLIGEGILRYFSNKSAFDDKLKVSCPAGVDNYLICTVIYTETQFTVPDLHALFWDKYMFIFWHDVEFNWCVVWHAREQMTSF